MTTSAIHRDENGFIWVGSKYGLNRYDGYEFKLFNKEKNNLISDRGITTIVDDKEGKLWLSFQINKSLKRFDIFDTHTERATPLEVYFKDQLPFPIHDLYALGQLSEQQTIWMTTKSGQLYFYEKGQFKKIAAGLPSSIELIVSDSEGAYWLGGNKDLISINSEGIILETRSLPSQISELWIEENDKLWMNLVTIENNYINVSAIWSKEKGATQLSAFPFLKKNKKVLYEPIFRSKNGLWYVQIDQRLHLFDQDGNWLFMFHEAINEQLKDDIRSCLDLGEEVWFTTSNGLLKTNVRKPFFHLIQDNTR